MKTIRKVLATLVLSILVITQFVFTAYAATAGAGSTVIKVVLDDKKLAFDVNPYIKGGRTLVPFRKIFEELGMKVTWNSSEKSVMAENNTIQLLLYIGKKYAYINGEKEEIDVAAEIKSGRTFVPLRFIGESCGAEVQWDAKCKTVIISNHGRKHGFGERITYKDLAFSIEGLEVIQETHSVVVKGLANMSDQRLIMELYDENRDYVLAEATFVEQENGAYIFNAELFIKRSFTPKYLYVKTITKENTLVKIAEVTIE